MDFTNSQVKKTASNFEKHNQKIKLNVMVIYKHALVHMHT